jgi:ABC-type multidrug transport system ATPase subunit
MSKKTTTLILELKKIQRIVNSSPVLDIRHLKFHKGTIYGVVGPVGSGKSSLLSILSGSVNPDKGSILYDYEPFKKNFFGYTQMPADVTYVNNNKTDNSTVKSLFRKSNASQVLSNYFSNLSADKILNTTIKKLSTGEKSAVELSHGIESDPRVLIVDNYALYFDNKMENKFRKKLVNINKDHGTTIILASPNEQALRSFCSVLIYLDNGHISKIRTGSHKPRPASRRRTSGYKKNNSTKSKSRYRGKNANPK